MTVLTALSVRAQISIGGSIYGGGNAGDTGGKTTVNVYAGNLHAVFAGARMANVGGSSFVHIDGAHASDYILADYVYGGNDIAGTIGTSSTLPKELTDTVENKINNSWNSFVRISTKTDTVNNIVQETDDAQKIYVGQLFGGGNGYYDYKTTTDETGTIYTVEDKHKTTDKVVATSKTPLSVPELAKTYLEILGGSIVYAYGGGNNATITENTVICLNNPSKVVNSIKDTRVTTAGEGELLTNDRFRNKMRINTGFSYPSSDKYQIGRLFGGNNMAEMAIRPTWNLISGKIRNLYSGGNKGAMTYYDEITHHGGILLEVKSDGMIIDNVFGGCRMADVNPYKRGIVAEDINGVHFPAGYAARVYITGGNINNVYGGNDVSGNVYGGNAVGIHSNINGNVYGGGNGSYPYTDNKALKDNDIFGDLYYGDSEHDFATGFQSVEALNAFRPNAESVSIRLSGKDADHPTIIGGAVYCGGNCATLRNDTPGQDASAQLKIGSYVIADKVFLGNNGENMKNPDILERYAKWVDENGNTVETGTDFSVMDFTNVAQDSREQTQFDKYMDGVAMMIKPEVVFDAKSNNDPEDYIPYSTQLGSIYCGGNVGSMKISGAIEVNFNDKVIVYDKVVGGSNEANIYQSDYNVQHLGGLLGAPDTNGNKLILNFGGLKIQPKRWVDENDKSKGLVWNTVDGRTFNTTTKKYESMDPVPATQEGGSVTPFDASKDLHRRFHGGNIYGGCYNNGHVNGNVVINLNASLIDRKGKNAIFDEVKENEGEAKLYDGNYVIEKRHTGVLLGEQGMDVLGRALNVFGGGYGGDSEIWGSTTINLNAGYTFQIFGGGEQGAIGRAVSHEASATDPTIHDLTYEPNEAYSTYINVRGNNEGVYRGHADDNANMADVEFIYGGSFEGLIAGSTHINLGNGRIFNTFAGSCNADILGHTETYIGRQVKLDYTPKMSQYANDENAYTTGFPWIRDHVYGGNDLGGRIMNTYSFVNRVSADIRDKVYNPKVTSASTYMEYLQGRVENIFGGCYGVYDYKDEHFRAYTDNNGLAKEGFTKPRMINAFINFKPNNHARNAVNRIYGAGQGYSGDSDRDVMQDRSYVLIDIPKENQKYQSMEVFGAGDYCGLGMRNEAALTRTVNNAQVEVMPALDPTIASANADSVTASAVIDLFRGQIGAAYGASCNEGITRRTIVNVPVGSTIKIGSIFGGAYGSDAYKPCDVYEAHVNYLTQSEDAYLISNPASNLTKGAIYGGNNYARRTLYSKINISAPVRQSHHKYGMTTATVYGAGCGSLTWNEYTEVNLNNGAQVWEVYGGGEAGSVMSAESVQKYINLNPNNLSPEAWTAAWSLGTGYDPEIENKTLLESLKEGYVNNTPTNLNNELVRVAEMDDRTTKTYRYNTNVIINKGAYVGNYAYGGGLGNAEDVFQGSGDVYGTTYIALLGGVVSKDLYAAGTSGAVYNLFNAENLTASSNAFIAGGSARNVYGGGWKGSVGYHQGEISDTTTVDVPGETHVVIGIRQDQTNVPDNYGFYNGVPAIQRNAYGGGEGGSVIGQANLTLNNGYIGYVYNSNSEYEEKLHDETWKDHVGLDRLSDCGNLFGGGYDDNSSVDTTNVKVWGGIIRNSIFGGGEIATIGRGATEESGVDNKERVLKAIYHPGKTHIEMYNGHVKRNVFGGGKGYNILGYGGTRGFYTDGYVFGKTEVYIHGGEIGTESGLAEGYGNVFGGGDVGFVYSKGYFSTKTISEKNANPGGSTGSPNHWYYYDDAGNLTEDCKVVIAPMLQLKSGKTASFDNVEYGAYDYVPTEYLNTLPADKSDTRWTNLYTGSKTGDDQTERGIHIHNAVFAGGNVSSNSENYSNATTVFGNTTATLYDVYHHDFITVGTEHTGGLYGGGNLSLVGGYRELNITNYGTDYYGLNQQISLAEYQTLSNRERAYFKLQYVCQLDNNGHTVGEKIDEDDYNKLSSEFKNTTYWIQYGFCSIYAGRLLNTIQRADFCGVFGSRLVLQGAKDRVADVADATEYTINRVGEVSLNQQRFTPNDDSLIHGNYFGIYSVVNYMGNLTSDVHFEDPRRYVEGDVPQESSAENTYYKWKVDHLDKRDRNNGTSYNQVALASGVFLELTTENSTPSNKVYGDITGVVELDLINVKKDIEGGGYVYARNEHGERSVKTGFTNVLLSSYNKMSGNEARTKKIYEYSTTTTYDWQTSGNFIHKSKRIVDDCYPVNGVYNDANGLYKTSPAHYWFIKGEVYIYDQIVSAYAGSASAYSKEVKIPLTITAGSNGKLKLLNVQPNLYAYYADEDRNENNKVPSDGITVDNERTTFHLNDVISWWDWNQLSDNEKKHFVKNTRVNVDSCTIDGTPYSAGTYVLEDDASVHSGNANQTAWKTFKAGSHTILDINGNAVTDLDNLFRSSNNISHETGYALTVDMNSPKDWDYWYRPILQSNGDKIKTEAYNALSEANKAKYILGPTYKLTGNNSGLYGQRQYSVGEVITKEVYDDYTSTVGQMSPQPDPDSQATAEPAYVALEDYGNTQAGNAIGKTAYDALSQTVKSKFGSAMVCINTIQLGDEEYVLMGELVSETKLDELAQKYFDYNNSKINADKFENKAQARAYIEEHLSPAYYIKSKGLYGGQYFQSGINYGAIKSWCALTDDRDKFSFNYDAFDVLVNSNYPGEGHTDTYQHPYDEEKSVEYNAVYTGSTDLTYYDNDGASHTISSGGSITREAYEKVRNDQMHYTRIAVDAKTGTGSETQTVYIVKETIINKGTPYAKGQDISEKDFNNLTAENKEKVAEVNFTKGNTAAVKYYCYEDYEPLSTSTFTPESGTKGKEGSIISLDVFANETNVPNYQKHFSIQGAEPTETTTLYVSRESNAKDVTSEKIISVVYQYTYYEADDEGDGVSLVNELHVLNIHLQLESGAPEIGPLTAPSAVLPGNSVGLKAPSVNPGLYEILTSGWELFDNETDAQLHRNGTPFTNNSTPLYWYQNQKVFLAFYSKTYLGKTYSNYVPLTVANYHDLDAVMKDKKHHLYVDHPDVARNSKIYIDNRTCESDPAKSELDLLKDFFDLSLQTEKAATGATADHELLNSRVKGGAKLEFILNSDVSPKAYANNWIPIGDANGQCFEGNFHGDGYTISGLNNSLFGNLCGNVYNLGVTGSFTSAGIVDTGDGYVENCWMRTTSTAAKTANPIFGNPTNWSQDRPNRIVNCYYLQNADDTNKYTNHSGNYGIPTAMDTTAFYNGTVAFNLNGFYLNKRYYDKQQTNGIQYKYLKSVNGNVPEEMSTGYYPSSYAYYPLDNNKTGNYGYVEDRYSDGDFIYAGGTIPEANDERMRVVTGETTSTVTYAPIWPDDYIYFGQMLTYGFNTSHPHQDYPSHIAKSDGRLTATELNNRVYRAPAYYRSKEMGSVHFNLYAHLAAKSAPKTLTDNKQKDAYPNMTAVDFYGHNDNTWAMGFKSEGYATGSPAFYPPLLDDEEGLIGIENNGETPNLLVYAPSAEAKASTHTVLTQSFVDPVYTNYYHDDNYRRVDIVNSGSVHGHLVQSNLKATTDHLLIDKRDFNCPIAYSFDNGHRMWYQRDPDNYVDRTKGWEGISLPFTADIVTTDTKGEITHFYNESASVDENTNTKIGHEYWLREFKSGGSSSNDVYTAIFNYPTAVTTGKEPDETREVRNTFLWDYYYEALAAHHQLDKNSDTYQTYYKDSRTYKRYARLKSATPYIIGFPGATYYEFDLSGNFSPANTAGWSSTRNLEKQVITFASKPKVDIGVSDDAIGVTFDGYTFMPNYLNSPTVDTGKNAFLLNTDGEDTDKGSKYVKSASTASLSAFRPYFLASASGARKTTRSIVFSSEQSQLKGADDHGDPTNKEIVGGLKSYTNKHKIIVESSLNYTVDVRIVNAAGNTVTTFSIEPDETVETDVNISGMYIIHSLDGKYTKKLAVRK